MSNISKEDDDSNNFGGWKQADYDSSESFGSLLGGDFRSNREKEKADNVKEVQQLARNESANAQFWRGVVVVLIIIAGLLVSMSTYAYLQDSEIEDFEARFQLISDTIQSTTRTRIDGAMTAVASIAESLKLTASNGSPFPFVTTQQFEVIASQALKNQHFESVFYAPIVDSSQVSAWRSYSTDHQGWIQTSRSVFLASHGGKSLGDYLDEPITSAIWPSSLFEKPYNPLWMMTPPPLEPSKSINYDFFSRDEFSSILDTIQETREGVFSNFARVDELIAFGMSPESHGEIHETFGSHLGSLHSFFIKPVVEDLQDEETIVGLLYGIFPWDIFLDGMVATESVDGIHGVLSNSCGQTYTYDFKGSKVELMGPGDLHDPSFEHNNVVVPVLQYQNPETVNVTGHCSYTLTVFASSTYKDQTTSSIPKLFTILVAMAFLLVIMTFIVYDRFVEKRNSKVVSTAALSNAILSSLFPKAVRDRLIREKEEEDDDDKNYQKNTFSQAGKQRLQSFLDDADDEGEQLGYDGKPIADFFPETTVMFADIAGFTAWSSTREPTQVFTLLECIYRAFDQIANRRRVFKVETVGDCYVAAAGLPTPRRDHAVVMARFARDCLNRMETITKKLEVVLGPDTAELALRVGLHSGPVTAGVLRGEKSRFQLFGDTMNTTSRVESNGKPGKIQVSQDTAHLLIEAGKSGWLTPREDKINAKGKGEMQTFWLISAGKGESAAASESSGESEFDDVVENIPNDVGAELQGWTPDEKTRRLIKWNSEVLLRQLQKVHARSQADIKTQSKHGTYQTPSTEFAAMPLREVKEIITLPRYDGKVARGSKITESLPKEVEEQLNAYVTAIACLYRKNAFHNFEHASHVAMSVSKLLARIVAPDINWDEADDVANTLHDHTYGITSDPLTQFACMFSALIHDVDHVGVPNTQLIKENPTLAAAYNEKSVAEQNSVDIAWSLLMEPQYRGLRRAIYKCDEEKKRFRELVVNSVMATDIMDKDLGAARKARWEKAFDGTFDGDTREEAVNRKATIVIEHLIQASDVAHTMQHWHIYRKWNERLFEEMYSAYKNGRAAKNPADFWYKGEIGFFDFYIIPLAKKLKDCGVFGVSSDEYLNYAELNRKEWEIRGEEIVSEMVQAIAAQEASHRFRGVRE